MTPELRAREVCDGEWNDDPSLFPLICEAIRAAVAEEREACAMAAESKKISAYNTTDPWNVGIDFAAAAIRARDKAEATV